MRGQRFPDRPKANSTGAASVTWICTRGKFHVCTLPVANVECTQATRFRDSGLIQLSKITIQLHPTSLSSLSTSSIGTVPELMADALAVKLTHAPSRRIHNASMLRRRIVDTTCSLSMKNLHILSCPRLTTPTINTITTTTCTAVVTVTASTTTITTNTRKPPANS
ncbi:hypothetical protein PV326_008853 [Microctonus aethiopoides]|nr:hypothetical protein PV326_008853 [Microctonus aethiopoides]